jgi:hypothetical protein
MKYIFLIIVNISVLFGTELNFSKLIKNEFNIASIGKIILKGKEKEFNSLVKYSGVRGQKYFYGKKFNISSLSEFKFFGDLSFEERYVFLTDRDNIIVYFAIMRFVNGEKKYEKKCEKAFPINPISKILKKDFTTTSIPYNCFDNKNISLEISFKEKNNKLSLIITEYDKNNKPKYTKNTFKIKGNKVIKFHKEIY